MDWSPGRGSEQLGVRPTLIIQTDAANSNPHYPNVMVTAITSRVRGVPTHVRVEPSRENGLTVPAEIMGEQIQTASKSRLVRKLGRPDEPTMQRVDQAIKLALSLT